MSEPYLIALDIDGTIVHEDGTLTQRVTDAVHAVIDAGHVVILATGRSQATTESMAAQLGIEPGHLISANGALVLERGSEGFEILHVETFDPSEALQAIAAVLPTGSFMVEDAAGNRRYTTGMVDWDLDGAELVDFDGLLTTPAMRVVVMSPDHEVDEFLEIVEGMGLHKVSYAIGYSSWLDIAPDGITKATGLDRVARLLDIPTQRIIAVGDGRNDVEMFEWVVAGGGRAVAMGQAVDEVKAAANDVTESVHDDGLALVLEGLLVSA